MLDIPTPGPNVVIKTKGLELADVARFETRHCCRCVMQLTRDNRLVMIHVEDNDSYAFPGGRPDFPAEPRDVTMRRELWQETGAKMSDLERTPLRYVGIIEEWYRAGKFAERVFCHIYVCRFGKSLGTPRFTEAERRIGFQQVFKTVKQAERLLAAPVLRPYYRSDITPGREQAMLKLTKPYLVL